MLSRLLSRCNQLAKRSWQKSLLSRPITTSDSGGVLPNPAKMPFGLLKTIFVIGPFIFIGGIMSREGAAWLEDNEIFSPEDDD